MFFEPLDLSASREGGPAAPQTFYQRVDLTSELVVDGDGKIALPRLGRFQALGRSTEDLQGDLVRAFGAQLGVRGDVHVALVERPPIYVLGLVRNPGSHKYVPGMLAVHALALSGGLERLREAGPEVRDAKRERERQAVAQERLKRLLARHSRLLAQRSGEKKIPVSDELVAMARKTEIASLIATEERLKANAEAARRSEAEVHDAAVRTARIEIVGLRANLQKLSVPLEARADRLKNLQGLSARGHGNPEALSSAQKDVADFEFQRQQMQGLINQAEQRATQAELAKIKAAADHEASIAREIVIVEDEIAALRQGIIGAASLAGSIEADMDGRGVRDGATLQIEIVRRGADGTVVVSLADETTELRPGDVVKVGAGRGGATALVKDGTASASQ
jgi:protein involved in polysaccharide export with SLBB domain